jgi:hypothetical protein
MYIGLPANDIFYLHLEILMATSPNTTAMDKILYELDQAHMDLVYKAELKKTIFSPPPVTSIRVLNRDTPLMVQKKSIKPFITKSNMDWDINPYEPQIGPGPAIPEESF